MKKRVVVTGLGVVSSIGIGREDFWKNLLEGKSGISEISGFDTTEFAVHMGGEVKNFDPSGFFLPKKTASYGRASLLAISAAKLALDDASLGDDYWSKKKVGVCMGTTMGETQVIESLNRGWVNSGVESLKPESILSYPAYMLPASISMEFGFDGPVTIIPNACAAGNFAIGHGYDLIRNSEVDFVLAGGADAFSKIAFVGFSRMFAVAPQKCQPFDKNRSGMIVAEGAAILVLESLESALARGAEIYAEIAGYGLSCDARHMTAPYSEGIKEAIESALLESGIDYQSVDYISAHGTGTVANDKEECLGIKKVFKDNYKNIPISSIKSMLGHSMGAASAIEAVACSLAVKNDLIPPTINYETPDPDCDIDCVANRYRQHKVSVALNNASAFGGNNSCLVLKKYPA